MRVLILGAGGHAQVVADILLRMKEAEADLFPIGYLDDNPALTGRSFLGLPVLGKLQDLSKFEHEAVIVAIGDNQTRTAIYTSLKERNEQFIIACHPRAIVAPDVKIGPGSMICAGAIVNPGSRIGANVILNTGCTVDHHSHIENHVHIAPGVHMGGEVYVGEGALVGIGATVMPGRRIGAWSIVGAGSLVHRDIPDHVVAIGTPARVIRHFQKERR